MPSSMSRVTSGSGPSELASLNWDDEETSGTYDSSKVAAAATSSAGSAWIAKPSQVGDPLSLKVIDLTGAENADEGGAISSHQPSSATWVSDFEPGPEFIYDPEEARVAFEEQERDDRAHERRLREESEKRGLRKQFGAKVDLTAVSYDDRGPNFGKSPPSALAALLTPPTHSLNTSGMGGGMGAHSRQNDGTVADRPIKQSNIFASPQVIAFRIPRIPANTDIFLQLDLGKESTTLLVSPPAFEPDFNGFGPIPQRLKDAALLRMYMSDYFSPRSTDYRWQEEFRMPDRAAVAGSTSTGTTTGGSNKQTAGAADDDDDDSAGPRQSRYLRQKRAAAHKSFSLPYSSALGHTGDTDANLVAVPVLGISGVKGAFYFSLFSSLPLANIEIYCRVNQKVIRPEDDVRHPWRIVRMRTVNSFSHDAMIAWFEANRTKLTLGTASLVEPNTGMNPLHLALGYLADVRLVRLLLRNYAKHIKLNLQDEELQTPVFKMVRRADIYDRSHPLYFRALDLLRLVAFEGGCSLDLQDKDGNTLVHFAARYHVLGSEFLPRLLEYGAPPDTRNNAGHTPAEEAELFGGGRCPVTNRVIPRKLPLDLRDTRLLLEAARVALSAARAEERLAASSFVELDDSARASTLVQSPTSFLDALSSIKQQESVRLEQSSPMRAARGLGRQSSSSFLAAGEAATTHVYYDQRGQRKTIHGLPSSILEAKKQREKAQRKAERERRRAHRQEGGDGIAHDAAGDSSSDEDAPSRQTTWSEAKKDARQARRALRAEERASKKVLGGSLSLEATMPPEEVGGVTESPKTRFERIGRRMSISNSLPSFVPPSSPHAHPRREGSEGGALSVASSEVSGGEDSATAASSNEDEGDAVVGGVDAVPIEESVVYSLSNPMDPTNVPSGAMRTLEVIDPARMGNLRPQCGKPQLLDGVPVEAEGGLEVGVMGGAFPTAVIRRSKVSGAPKLRGTHTKEFARQVLSSTTPTSFAAGPPFLSSPAFALRGATSNLSSLGLPDTDMRDVAALRPSSIRGEAPPPATRFEAYLAHAASVVSAIGSNSLASLNSDPKPRGKKRSILQARNDEGGRESGAEDSDASSEASEAEAAQEAAHYRAYQASIAEDAAVGGHKGRAGQGGNAGGSCSLNGDCVEDGESRSFHSSSVPPSSELPLDEAKEVQRQLAAVGNPNVPRRQRLDFSTGDGGSRNYETYLAKASKMGLEELRKEEAGGQGRKGGLWASGEVGRVPRNALLTLRPQPSDALAIAPSNKSKHQPGDSDSKPVLLASVYDPAPVYNMLLEKRRVASEPGVLVDVRLASTEGQLRTNRFQRQGGGANSLLAVPTYAFLKRFEERRGATDGSRQHAVDATEEELYPVGSPARVKRDATEHIIASNRERLADAALRDVLRQVDRTGNGLPSVRHTHDELVARLEQKRASEMALLDTARSKHDTLSDSGLALEATMHRQGNTTLSNTAATVAAGDAVLRARMQRQVLEDMAFRVTDPDVLVLGGFDGSYGLENPTTLKPISEAIKKPVAVKLPPASELRAGSGGNLEPLDGSTINAPNRNVHEEEGEDPLVALIARAIRARNNAHNSGTCSTTLPPITPASPQATKAPIRTGRLGDVGNDEEMATSIVSTIPQPTLDRLRGEFDALANARAPKGTLSVPELVQHIMRLDTIGVPLSSHEVEERIVRMGGILGPHTATAKGPTKSGGMTTVDFNGYVVVMLKLSLL